MCPGGPQAKERGNALYRAGQFAEATEAYTTALDATDLDAATRATLLKNRAACKLKLVRAGRQGPRGTRASPNGPVGGTICACVRVCGCVTGAGVGLLTRTSQRTR